MSESNFKVIIGFNDFQNIEKLNPTKLIIKPSQDSKKQLSKKFPFKDKFQFELNSIEEDLKFEIYLEKNKKLMGRYDIVVPKQAALQEEYEEQKQLKIRINDNQEKKQVPEILGQYYLIILNNKISEQNKRVNGQFQNQNNSSSQKVNQEQHPQVDQRRSIEKKSDKKLQSLLGGKPITNPNKLQQPEQSNLSNIQQQIQNLDKQLQKNNLSYNRSPNESNKRKKYNNTYCESLINKCVNTHLQNNNFELMPQRKQKIEDCVYLVKVNHDLNQTPSQNDIIQSESSQKKTDKRCYSSEKFSQKQSNQSRQTSTQTQAKNLENLCATSEQGKNQMQKNSRELVDLQEKLDQGNCLSGSNNKKNLKNGVDLEVFNVIQNIDFDHQKNKNILEYLKMIIYILDQKIQKTNSLQLENECLEEELRASEDARRELQETITETAKEQKQQNQQMKEFYEKKLRNQSISIDDKSNDTQEKLRKTIVLYDEAEKSRAEIENELNNTREQLEQMKEVQEKWESQKKELQLRNEQIENKSLDFQRKLSIIDDNFMNLKNQYKECIEELDKKKEECNTFQNDLDKERSKNQQLKVDITALKHKVQVQKAQESLIHSLQEQLSKKTQDLKDIKDQLEKRIRLQIKKNNNDQSFRVSRISQMDALSLVNFQKNESVENLIKKLNEEINSLKKENIELKMLNSNLEQVLCLKQDLNKQLEVLKDKIQKTQEEKATLKYNNGQLQDQLLNLQDQLYDQKKIQQSLKKKQQEQENHSNSLRRQILKMREQGGYVPHQNDPIDKRLADYINANNMNYQVKTLFIREGEGVYQFGTKRVYVKIEGPKINIRVGGGFLGIEDFIEYYAPLELEKLQRQDPVKILNNNIAINKTIEGKCVHEFERSKDVAYNPKTFDDLSFRKINKSQAEQ